MADSTLDPRSIARAIALDAADDTEHVGDFVEAIELGDNVTDFRFEALLRGYEGWQWSVTLYHDIELDRWTVNESSLVPTDRSLLPPEWIPWKDRLEPSDLSVTDSIGTDPDDPRLESGMDVDAKATETKTKTESSENQSSDDDESSESDANDADAAASSDASAQSQDGSDTKINETNSDDTRTDETSADFLKTVGATDESGKLVPPEPPEGVTSPEDMADVVEEFALSRRHVMTPLGRAQTAKRWYEGPRGPKSLSTKTAGGNPCSTCGFFIPLQGELNVMFGVCANKWSPDDGRVVSLDHGCGEHSEIEPPEPSRLWIQSKPAFDDLHIDVIAQSPRDERDDVELIEQLEGERDSDAEDLASEADIAANTTVDDESEETSGNESDDAQPDVETTVDLSGQDAAESDGDADTSDDSDDVDDSGDASDDTDETETIEDSEESEKAEESDDSDDTNDSDDSAESEESAESEKSDEVADADSKEIGSDDINESEESGETENSETESAE